ncbi:MAG TPA: cytochrome b [Stellaceae bacterium]|nr:cytochrome b [Stellaceae bacterium]
MTSRENGGPPGPGYDPVARLLHWLNANLALVTVALAWCLISAPRHGEARAWLVMLHGSCGIAVLALLVLWSGWRLKHRSPPLRPVLSRIEVWLARTIQAVLVALLAAMPFSGYVSLAAAGHAVSLFGVVAIPPLVPQSGRLSQAAIALHLVGQFLIYGLVAMHIGAAVLHGLVRRDGILERMLPRRS